MQTCCPHCQTTFRVTDEQLSAAGGKVRCGRCFGIFTASEHRIEQNEAADTNPPPESDTTTPSTDNEGRIQIDAGADDKTTPTNNGQDLDSTPLDDQLLEEISLRDATPPAKHGVVFPLVASLFLCTTLVTQYLYFNRDQLGQDPQLRPLLSQACHHIEQLAGDIIPCELAPMHAPQHIALSQREVRLHPEYGQTLLVSARVNNTADFAQAYPLLELTFHDVNGVTLFARRFKAEEYLANGFDAQREFGPQQSAQIELELADPGPQAVGYEFNFL